MNTNPFPFITTGTTIPEFDWNLGASSGDVHIGMIYGATYSDVVIRFSSGRPGAYQQPEGIIVVRIDADRRVTEVISATGRPAPRTTAFSGRMSGEWVRVSDGHGCTEMVQA